MLREKSIYDEIFSPFEATLEASRKQAKQKNYAMVYIYLLLLIPLVAALTCAGVIFATLVGCIRSAVVSPFQILKGKK